MLCKNNSKIEKEIWFVLYLLIELNIIKLLGLKKRLTDEKLLEQVQEIKFGSFQRDMKYVGVCRILESLKSNGFCVDNKRVAKTIKLIDEEGAYERRKKFIPHQKIPCEEYTAPGSGHTMHSNINEKLKRYKLYLIHSFYFFISLYFILSYFIT